MKVTKKLRDVTKEEFRKWKDINCLRGKINCSDCPFYKVSCCAEAKDSWVFNKDMYSDKFLDQTIEVEVVDILNKEEKEYLSAVIKPFRDKAKSIIKFSCTFNERYYIKIVYDDDDTWGKNMAITMPPFKKDKMYKNMELGEKYTLEELGL